MPPDSKNVCLSGKTGSGRRGRNDPINPAQTSEPKGQQFSPVLNVIQLARILAAMW